MTLRGSSPAYLSGKGVPTHLFTHSQAERQEPYVPAAALEGSQPPAHLGGREERLSQLRAGRRGRHLS